MYRQLNKPDINWSNYIREKLKWKYFLDNF